MSKEVFTREKMFEMMQRRKVEAAMSSLEATKYTVETITQPIKKLKELYVETPLVESKTERALIVVPEGPLEAQASLIQEFIWERSRVTIPIKRDFEVKEADLKSYHAILLGNMLNNKLICDLYGKRFVFVDASYPGGSGYVVRTVHNPYGYGKNSILIGGSNEEGIKKGTQKFLSLLGAAKNMKLGYTIEVETPHLKDFGEPTKEFVDETMQRVMRLLVMGGSITGISEGILAGFKYYLTGDERWAELFKRVFMLYIDSVENFGSWLLEHMTAPDFWTFQLTNIWDLIEESPVFTDDERLRMTNCLVGLLRYTSKMGYLQGIPKDAVRWNHETFPALSLYFGGNYFLKYYNWEEAKGWINLAEICLDPMQECFKSADDAGGYQCLALNHAAVYSLFRGDLRYFTSGNARKSADLAVSLIDNLGNQTSHGDCGFSPKIGNALPVLLRVAWYYKDGEYQWVAENYENLEKFYAVYLGSVMWDAPLCLSDVKPVRPKRFLGVKVVPLDPRVYDFTSSPRSRYPTKPNVPPKKSFDKLTFRSSFDPSRQYLLLDGYSRGHHLHFDGNSIIRFTDRDRIFLFDGDYIKTGISQHNSVLVIRNGECPLLPPMCGLEYLADLDQTGFTKTYINEYNGVDWYRNIIWLKDKFFLIIDELKAREGGDYVFKCLWRSMGKTELLNRTFKVEQGGKEFYIKNVDGAKLRLGEDKENGERYWREYKHAEPVIKVLREVKERSMKAKEDENFINLLYTSGVGTKQNFDATKLGPKQVLIIGDENAFAGVCDDEWNRGLLTVKASMFYVSPKTLALVGLRAISYAEQTTLRSGKPVSIEINLEDGEGTVSADEETKMEMKIEGEGRVLLNGKSIEKVNGLFSFKVPRGKSKLRVINGLKPLREKILEQLRFERPFREDKELEGRKEGSGGGLREAWSYNLPGKVKAICTEDINKDDLEEVIVGSEDGHLHIFNSMGEVLWKFRAEGTVNTVTAVDINGDGKTEVLIGSGDGYLRVFTPNGNEIWRYKFGSYHGRQGRVRDVSVSDIDGDGEPEILVGTEAWQLYAIKGDGRLLWQTEVYAHSTTDVEVEDVNNDGDKEIIVGTEYYGFNLLDKKGDLLWRFWGGPGFNIIKAADLDGNGVKEIVAGSEDGNVYVVDGQGKLKWKSNVGDNVTTIEIIDEEKKEILVGSESLHVYLIDHEGNKKWIRNVGDEVKAVALGNVRKGTVELIVGTDEPSINVLDRNGRTLARIPVESEVTQLKVADLDHCGKKEVIVGLKDGRIKVLK